MRKSPSRICLKQTYYLIRIKAKIFEVGVVFSADDRKGAYMFFGLIEQESFETHLGYQFNIKGTGPDNIGKSFGVGLSSIYKVTMDVSSYDG